MDRSRSVSFSPYKSLQIYRLNHNYTAVFPQQNLPSPLHTFIRPIPNKTMAGTTTHHCPKKSQGGCRRAKTPGGAPYCSNHQIYCKVPGCSSEYPFLKTEQCKACNNRKAYEQKQKDEKKADDKAKKDKKDREERERREKVQSRKPEIKNKK